MTDQTHIDGTVTPRSEPTRIIKIGATRIVADEAMAQLSAEELRVLLKTTYPEVAHASVREITLDDGTPVLEFIAQPGRKG